LLLTTEHHAKDTNGSPLLSGSDPAKCLGSATGAQKLSDKLQTTEPLELPPVAPISHRSSVAAASGPGARPLPFHRESKFMTTSQMLRMFAYGCTPPPAGAKVVYVDGGWDMFHAGHVEFLREARKLGDFLLVGVHNDIAVNNARGSNYPIMNLNERVLSVLACKHVGDVVIDPPWHMTREMIAALNIAVVAHGTTNDPHDDGGADPFEVPKAMGIYHTVKSTRQDLTVDSIVTRIQANHEKMRAKVEKKMKSEREYYTQRYGFQAS